MMTMEISRLHSLLLYTLCLLGLIIPTTKAQPTFLFIECQNTSTYESSLNTLSSDLFSFDLSSTLSAALLSNNASTLFANGFYSFTARTPRSNPQPTYGLFLCRGDVSAAVCQECVNFASVDIIQRCPRSKRITIWYDQCMLRYSSKPMYAIPDTGYGGILRNTQNVTNVTRFQDALGEVLIDIATRASSGQSGKKFATGEANYSRLQPIYGLAQCTPDLFDSDCNSCLQNCISVFPSCCGGNPGARVLFPSCSVRYEMFPFYNTSIGAALPPPSLVLPPPPLPPRTTTSSPGKKGISFHAIDLIVIVVPIGVSVLLYTACFCFLNRRAKKQSKHIIEDNVAIEITTMESLQYDLGTVQVATNNFSNENKIGGGGYGPVYKGLLPDGQAIAVKRLARTSGQGVDEFKNEVVLVATLQHRNLVRLLGFCLEGEEKILIYEFLPNKSLDYILFDPQERQMLDWSRRYRIIGDIARGLLYLHEYSPHKIIHRDLKASNILLDGDMNAKISDFGTARILGVDQTQGNASEIVGTFGYMSPEYAMHGQFSIKSDVYSFGVSVLEIIIGKKSSCFYQHGVADLLSYAWKLWSDGTPLDLLEPTQKLSYSIDEVNRCIHIALLCVQDNPDDRPSMATVVSMLDGYSTTLSVPQQPAFFARSGTGLELDRSSSKSVVWSVNEASISELEPR